MAGDLLLQQYLQLFHVRRVLEADATLADEGTFVMA